MIIQSSQIAMGSKHLYQQTETEQEQLRYWTDVPAEQQEARPPSPVKNDRVSLEISKDEFLLAQKTNQSHKNTEIDSETEEDLRDGWKLTLLRRLVERLTGTKIKLIKVKPDADVSNETADPAQQPAPSSSGEENQGWGLEYHYQHSYQESEFSHFSATGQVLTADGQQIDINIELGMSCSFSSHENIDIKAGDALKDPLVINYAGTAAQLIETDLHFDLDLDGESDQMKFVSSGSGFLALDKNNDGQINDGSELFGPTSGDGFAELAAYDQDGNNWIDENDTIFHRLSIWERSPQGETQLLALAQLNIGAIYLDRISTPFKITDQQNQQLGQVQSSGLYLQENGLPGTIQQLDLVV